MSASSLVRPPVRFVVPPFSPLYQPALGVSSLTAMLASAGIAADVCYLNVRYAAEIGEELYARVGASQPAHYLMGEMIFAAALWGDDDAVWTRYCVWVENEFARAIAGRMPRDLQRVFEDARRLRGEATAVIARWADMVLADAPRVVGFTSTFQQNVASLALAQEIRRRRTSADTAIVFGGANCEDEMGAALAELFPFIDHVVSGEGEAIIVELIRSIIEPVGRRQPRFVRADVVTDLDALPVPRFDAYFQAARCAAFDEPVHLVAESSRGCWWGMKSHCTFCGLNGLTMEYRSKRAERFADELHELADRYGTDSFALADNILDMRYVTTLFPLLASDLAPLRLFYEVKANLRKPQLLALAAGGVVRLQPGIESLSSPVLKLMAKGTTRLQNLQLIKWCEEYRVEAAWNMLYGFPGERPAEYAEMAALVPDVVHFVPPEGASRIRIDRFSPYWKTPQDFGLRDLRHVTAYDFAYDGVPRAQRTALAYYFEYDHDDLDDDLSYTHPLLLAINRWRELYGRRTLEVANDGGIVGVVDSRFDGVSTFTPLTAAELAVLGALDAMTTRDRCFAAVNESLAPGCELDTAKLDAILDEFLRRRWVLSEKNALLSIVLDRDAWKEVVAARTQAQFAGLGLSRSVPSAISLRPP